MIHFQSVFILGSLLLLSSCASIKHQDISYLKETNTTKEQPTLNVFSPRNSKYENTPVLVFVHGGNWNSGDKKTYNFLGRNFAKKGITTVIVGYTLSPAANFDTMANQVGQAVMWTKNNIANYKGDPNKIFLTGHSAGGHLIALVGTSYKYVTEKNLIKGIILNDAAGLDMKHYLEEFPPTVKDDYLTTWTNDPDQWRYASPIYFIDERTPPFKIYLGSKTYPSITTANERFLKELHNFQPKVEFIILNKKHVPMMTQYIFPWNKRYNEIIDFMESKIN